MKNLVHIAGYIYVSPDSIAKVEGFYDALVIRVTLKDGTVLNRELLAALLEREMAWTHSRRVQYLESQGCSKADAELSAATSVTKERVFNRILETTIRHWNGETK